MSDENADRDRSDRNGRDRPETDGTDREALGYAEEELGGRGRDAGDDRDRDDEKVVGTAPEAGAIDEPTTTSAQASRESRWGIQEGLAIGLVSIFSGLLIVFGLMQATGLITLPGPLEDSAIGHWSLFVALGVLFLAAFAYSQRGT